MAAFDNYRAQRSEDVAELNQQKLHQPSSQIYKTLGKSHHKSSE